jgi:hypothetical protein
MTEHGNLVFHERQNGAYTLLTVYAYNGVLFKIMEWAPCRVVEVNRSAGDRPREHSLDISDLLLLCPNIPTLKIRLKLNYRVILFAMPINA